MKRKTYPKYKPSGVEWLGDVPEHWEVRRGRFAMSVNPPSPQLRALEQDDEVSFVPMESVGVAGGLNLEQRRFLADISSGYTEFQDGDVVVAKITPCFENGKAALACGLLNGAAYGTTELHVLRSGLSTDSSFLFYVAVSDTFRKLGESEMFGAGGQKRVPPEFCKDFRTPMPPLPEQRAIAAFLDRETGRIDSLIAKKRELVERLKEKRTALISYTVTHGLPPDAAKKAGLPVNPQLKLSGVVWFEEVPEHWIVSKLGFLVDKAGSGKTPRGGSQSYQSEGVMLIRSQNVYDDGLRLEDVAFIDDETDEDMENSRVNARDVLLNITGASLGRCAVVPATFPKANVNQHVCIVRPSAKKLDPSFAQFSLIASFVKAQIFADEEGSSREGLNFQQVRNLVIAVPPLPEQAAIAAYLDVETAKLDALVAKVAEAVERLQEYRTALITAAVTGKIDVRECYQYGNSSC